MESPAFWGGFLAVAAAIGLLCAVLWNKWNQVKQKYIGAARMLSAVREIEQEARPRSVSGCDRLVIPKIRKDFPDFEPETARTRARAYLTRQLGDRQDFEIHSLVFARYLPAVSGKTVVFQAAVSWKEQGAVVQKRYDLNAAYRLETGDAQVAANCPNCGGPLGFGAVECPYCGSRVVNVMDRTWCFTDLRES